MMEEWYERIESVLKSEGWEIDPENSYVFTKRLQGKALYIYPSLKLFKYWEDIRAHSEFVEGSVLISESDLLALIN
ncbi:hypothetical protein GCM10028807_58150 [Spirosoma daeguense]